MLFMDWVEASSDENVAARAAADSVALADEMFAFVERIHNDARNLANNKNPDFLIVAQNAPICCTKKSLRKVYGVRAVEALMTGTV